jgi:hypothetical protein
MADTYEAAEEYEKAMQELQTACSFFKKDRFEVVNLAFFDRFYSSLVCVAY